MRSEAGARSPYLVALTGYAQPEDVRRAQEAGFNRHLAFYKSTAIPQARNIVLEELGVETRPVPVQDEGLAWDQLPDDEPFTHLKPLR